MTKKAKRNILRQIQQKYLQEIDFSNLPKWEEAPPEMGGGTSRNGRRHLPIWEEAPPEMGGGTVLRSRAREN
jgi:spermidine/putrescine-binding protein